MVSIIVSRVAERGRSLLTHLTRRESGYATLTAVLVLLFLGAIVITPILVYMDTGLDAGRAHEKRTDELYAADAGVNLAIWQLQYGGLELDLLGEEAKFPSPEFPAPININDKKVHVIVENVTPSEEDKPVYQITSTAESDDIDSSTTVAAYVTPFSFFDNAITSRGNVTLGSNSDVYGNVQYDGLPGEDQESFEPTIHGMIHDGDLLPNVDDIEDIWPTPELLRSTYEEDLQDQDPLLGFPYSPYPDYSGSTINIEDWKNIGPLRSQGDLTILNGGVPATLTLNGTVYVKGDLLFQQPGGAHEYTLDLNGHTIFAEGVIDLPSQCTVTGSGCIIALGEVRFLPIVEATSIDFIFIMSVTDKVRLQPKGAFYGSVAGDVDVELQPGGSVNRAEALGSPWLLNFPWGNKLRILTYTIEQH